MHYTCVKTEKAVGMVLSHDVTMIKPGEFKGARFKKGHVIKEADVPVLLSMGKEHIYSLELEDGELHEDEASQRIARAVAGDHIDLQGPSEGKIDFVARHPGLLKVNVPALARVNAVSKVIMATQHNDTPVQAQEKLAGTRVIPLVVPEEIVDSVEEIAQKTGPIVFVKSYQKMEVGVLVTGKEVYEGEVEDAFYPMLKEKALKFNLPAPRIDYAPDDAAEISQKICDYVEEDVDLIVVTGGMSVDPDDVTPRGIRMSGAQIVKYGAPVLPGAMFLMAYHEGGNGKQHQKKIPITGLPACGMFFKTTVFDLVFPRILAGEEITEHDIARLGHGGLCLQCDNCSYPDCSFGKGGFTNDLSHNLS